MVDHEGGKIVDKLQKLRALRRAREHVLLTSTADHVGSEGLAFGVRTLGADGEFELFSSDEVARRLWVARGGRLLSILAPSSGGASGAFGAGALAGSRTTGMPPEFTLPGR